MAIKRAENNVDMGIAHPMPNKPKSKYIPNKYARGTRKTKEVRIAVSIVIFVFPYPFTSP
jgi:hypothetical protein